MTHGSLTEHSLMTPIWKGIGREGNRKGREGSGYVCMHRWVPNARVADDAMRGATR